MSRKREKKRQRSNELSRFLTAVKLKLTLLVTVVIGLVLVPLQLVSLVKQSSTWRMMVGKRELDDPGTSERKRARVLNKQSKMLAEYRLVVGGEGEGEGEKGRLGEEEFKAMKKELAERKRALMQLPRFMTNSTTGTTASIFQTEYSKRTPLLLSDIEHLVTYAYGGNALIPPPSRWCSLQKPNRLNNIVILVVDGIGLTEFVDNEELFGGTMEIFGGDDSNRAIVEFLSPGWYSSSLEKEVNNWGVVGGQGNGSEELKKTVVEQEEPQEQKPCNEENTPTTTPHPENFQNVLNQLTSVFPIAGKRKHNSIPPTDSFSRTDLILTLPQLIQENYPLPIPSTALSKFNYEPTSLTYSPVNPQSKMFSIDCEMCVTVDDPQALTRIGIVDEELNTVYESLVKPDSEIKDYLTRWSGITKEMMEGVETKIVDVQRRVKEIVEENPDCVFIGQSLCCDLKAMRMTHPYIIDTSVIFNLTGIQGRKSSLRDLTWNLIDEEIQAGTINRNRNIGHCPVEDAAAAMKLVKAKLEKGFSFGNALKNSLYLRQSTKLALDPMFMGNSFKKSKLDKNVLLVHQQTDQEEPTNNLITHHTSTSNRTTIKYLNTHIFEQYMSIGFYRIKPTTDLNRSLIKLDKRVAKLYGNLGSNSLFIVLCSRDGVKGEGSVWSDCSRKNNGVGFVRCKVNVGVGRRID